MRGLGPIGLEPASLNVVQARGPWIRAQDGKLYLDMISGLQVSILGHNHPRIRKAVCKQIRKHDHVMVYGVWPQIIQYKFVKELLRILPPGLEIFYPTCTGTEAVESALKFACYLSGRTKVLAFERAYHGETQGSLALFGNSKYRRTFQWTRAEVGHLPWNRRNGLKQIKDDVAAVIVELIQGEGGIRPMNPEFLSEVEQRCKQNGVLLIVDEVQTGLGRVGAWWASTRMNLEPDMLVAGKALGGGFPLGGVAMKAADVPLLIKEGLIPHLTTFGGHPVACAAGIALLHELRKGHWPERVTRRESRVRETLRITAKEYPKIIRDIRGIGWMWGLRLRDADTALAVEHSLFRRGVLLDRPLMAPDVLRICPPINIKRSIFLRFRDILNDVLHELSGS